MSPGRVVFNTEMKCRSIKDALLACMAHTCLVFAVFAVCALDVSAYQCVYCNPGKYKNLFDNSACVSCSANTYLDYSGAVSQSECQGCGLNIQSPIGSTAKAACLCNAGFFGPAGGPCTQCATGKFAANTGQTACSSCPANTDSDVQSTALTSCQCVAGWTGPNGGSCTQCVASTYKSTRGSQACDACSATTMTSGIGNTDVNACICKAGYTGGGGAMACSGCVAGKYKETSGPADCSLCGLDKYSTTFAATSSAVCESCPSNSVSGQGSSAVGACTCNTGYTGVDGSACSACSAGLWKDTTGSAACTQCGVGKYNTASAQKSELACLSCPENSWALVPGSSSISSCICNAGYTGSDGNCVACGAGKWKVSTGSALCTSCLPDKYSTSLGASSSATCLPCPSSSNAPEGSIALAACVCNMGFTGPGGLAASGVTPCVACLAGTWKGTSGSATCTNCLANQYSTITAATSNVCQSCVANTQSGAASQAVTSCICNAGFTGPNGGNCSACIPGTYKTAAGSATCQNCLAGTYSITPAKTDATCSPCPLSSNALSGSDELTDCLCNAGYSGPNGGTCNACGSGRYKPTSGSATCSDCIANTYQPNAVAILNTACLSCPSNSISSAVSPLLESCMCNSGYSGPNGGSCTACYMGKYKSLPGPQQCTNCNNATYSSATAATTYSTCLECPLNSSSSMGSTARSDCHCAFGFSTLKLGQPDSSCQQCTKGTYNQILDAEACSKCTAGKYSSSFGSVSVETCLECPVNTYSGEGMPQCDACPGNSTSVPKSSVITACQCNPGFFGANGQPCQTCQAGTWKSLWGPSECINCPKDKYSSEVARTSSTQCQDCLANSESVQGSSTRTACKCSVGWTSSVSGLDGEACTACSAGKYKNYTGYAACALCAANTYVDTTASTSPTACKSCFINSKSGEGSSSIEQCQCVGGFERAA